MMSTILILAIFHILFLIYVAPVILILFAVVYVITTKSIDITGKILIIIVCLLIVFVTLIHIKADRPSDLYIKMKTINDNQSMIGLSKKEVIELLEEPSKIHKSSNTGKEVYLYNAGNIFKEITWRARFSLWAKTFILL